MRGVRVGYGSFVVLEDMDLTAADGEIVAVTGVNGAGKSTLLSCLAGLHRPAAGSVTVLGAPPRDDAAFWRAVALVADQPTWYPGLTLRGASGTRPGHPRAGPGLVPAGGRAHRHLRVVGPGRRGPVRPVLRPAAAAVAGRRAGAAQQAAAARRAGAEPGPRVPAGTGGPAGGQYAGTAARSSWPPTTTISPCRGGVSVAGGGSRGRQ